MLRKYIFYPSHVLEEQPIELDENLTYEERFIKILNKKEKELRNKKIALVKVIWRNQATEQAIWEREEGIHEK